MRKFIFNLHWFFGISAGLIITVVGVTGGMLSLQPQILKWMNPGIVTVEQGQAAMPPALLIAAVNKQRPDKTIVGLTLKKEPDLAAEIRFAPEEGQRRGQSVYLNPYSGELTGQPAGRDIFITIMRLHRWLLVGDIGKQIVGASTVVLILLALSGIYFRWPKGKKRWSWRYWLTMRTSLSGRPFWWQIHAVVGTWVVPLYLLASLTGLYWSYEWYRDTLYVVSGVERGKHPLAETQGESPPAEQLNFVWEQFKQIAPAFREAQLNLPLSDTATVRYLAENTWHDRAYSMIELNTYSGEALSHQRYADKPLNQKLMGSMLPLHSGEFFGWPGLILMMLASLAMPLFFISGWYLYLSRKRKKGKKPAEVSR